MRPAFHSPEDTMRKRFHWMTAAVCCLACLALPVPSPAAVTRIEIRERLPYADGRAFDGVGAYQRLLGRVHFAVDPAAAANARVVDVELAPRNATGMVEFAADLEILAPVDLTKARGTLLYDVNNRGNRLALGQFNTGADEFLMRQGYIVVWSGWIAEVLPGGGRLRLDAPVATENGEPITGLVRADMAPDSATERMNITYGATNGSYEPTERGLREATLTWRLREADPRVPIPRQQWRIETTWQTGGSERGALPLVELVIPAGFRPGCLYELIYEAHGPIVQGLGMAGIRDLVSCLRHETGVMNPLLVDGRPVVERAIGFGVSQSGRLLRMFLYDGFNADESGRPVFDGLIPHVAGAGLGFFNHRFASPTRHNTQHDNHLYPVDLFPFAYGDQTDPHTGRAEGLLTKARAAGVVPKIVHTQTSAEYWTRAGSLVHTDPQGLEDAQIPPEVRIYAIGGAQHGPGSGVPGERTTGWLPANPTDYRPIMRALLTALDDWIGQGIEPPASFYPRVSEGTLRGWRHDDSGWPPLPGVRYPDIIHQPEWRDYGPEFAALRRISVHPPGIRGNYRVLAPAYDPDGNEQGLLALPSIAVPVATYTGWNLRHPSIGSETELVSLMGSYVPFPRTAADRQRTGDPRRAVLERYPTYDAYIEQFTAAARRLIDQRYLLADDLPLLLDQAAKNRALWAP
jgi:hypothetical protein